MTVAATTQFEAELYTLKQTTLLRLPEDASKQMTSRGQVAVVGTMNGHEFKTVLEPDGYCGHWIRVDDALQKSAGVHAGDTVKVAISVTKDWPEPTIPKDIADGLKSGSQKVKDKWKDITPMARWEWIRWVNSTGNSETRDIRIEKTISKLEGKHRRPCCFNLAACTDPALSKSGRLISL